MVYHNALTKESMTDGVIVCGDPFRVDRFAKLLEDPKSAVQNREYRSIQGKYQGKNITIISHGVGSAGAAICFDELMQQGAKKIIRIGTAGGLYDSTKVGDVVCATAAVREDGASLKMVPANYPAVCDFKLVDKLDQKLKKYGDNYRSGVVLTSDLFYPKVLDPGLKLYKDAGVVAVEMELSTLLTLAGLHKVQAAGVFVLDGNPLQWDEGNYDPKASIKDDRLMELAAFSMGVITG